MSPHQIKSIFFLFSGSNLSYLMFQYYIKILGIQDKISVHRKMNQSEEVLPENSTSIASHPHPFPLGIDEYNCFFDFTNINIDNGFWHNI